MIKLIALDMDGTILNSDHVISERTINAIKSAQEKGIEVIISTGRGYPDGVLLVKDTGLELGFSCMNGAEIRNVDGEIIHTSPLTNGQALEIMTILDEENVIYDMYVNELIYTDSIEEQVNMFRRFTPEKDEAEFDDMLEKVKVRMEEGFIKEVKSFHEIINHADAVVYKMLALSDNLDALAKAEERLKKVAGISVSSSFTGNLEITNEAGQKGFALEKYAAHCGVTMAETMAVGDNYNDLSMMEKAGFSVAMGNAPDDIKAKCDFVTETNENDGVALAIEKILKEQ